MTNTYFKSKEQYFQFRENFANASNHVKSKPTCEACDEWHTHEQELTYDTGMSRMKGWLRAEHFIFLNIMRGKPIHHGFTPCTNRNKLSNGANIWQGLDEGVSELRRVILGAKDIQEIAQGKPNLRRRYFNEFIAPLLGEKPMYGTYLDILCSLEDKLKEHKTYYSSFGEGYKIAQKMLKEELKPKNYQEFMKIVDEITNDTKKAA